MWDRGFIAERLSPRRLVHPLHRLRVLGLRTGALADDDRLEAALCQQLHQGLRLRAELGLSKGPVALLAAGRELNKFIMKRISILIYYAFRLLKYIIQSMTSSYSFPRRERI